MTFALILSLSQYRYDGDTFKDDFWGNEDYSIFLTKSIVIDTPLSELKAKVYGNGLIITCTQLCFTTISQNSALVNVTIQFTNQEDTKNMIAASIQGSYLYQVSILGTGIITTTLTQSQISYWSGGFIAQVVASSNITDSDLSLNQLVGTAVSLNISNSRIVYGETDNFTFCINLNQCQINYIFNSFIFMQKIVEVNIFQSVNVFDSSSLYIKETQISIFGALKIVTNSTFQIVNITGNNDSALSTSIQGLNIKNSYIMIQNAHVDLGFNLLKNGSLSFSLETSVFNITNLFQGQLFTSLQRINFTNSLFAISNFTMNLGSSLVAQSTLETIFINSSVIIQNGNISDNFAQLSLFIGSQQQLNIMSFNISFTNITQISGAITNLQFFSQQASGTYNNWFVNINNISLIQVKVEVLSSLQTTSFLNQQNLSLSVQNITFSTDNQQFIALGTGMYNFAALSLNFTTQKLPLTVAIFSDISNIIGGPNLFANIIQPPTPNIINFIDKNTLCPDCIDQCFIRGVTTTSPDCQSYNNQPIAWYNTQLNQINSPILPIITLNNTNKLFYVFSFDNQLKQNCLSPDCEIAQISQLACQDFGCKNDFCSCEICKGKVCLKSENRALQGTIILTNYTFCDLEYQMTAQNTCEVNCTVLVAENASCNVIGTQNSTCQLSDITGRFSCICPQKIDFLTSPALLCEEGCPAINSTQGVCTGLQTSACKLNYLNSANSFSCDLNFCDYNLPGTLCTYPTDQFKPEFTQNYKCFSLIQGMPRCYNEKTFNYCSACEQFESGKCNAQNYNSTSINQTDSQNIFQTQLSCECVRSGYSGQFCDIYDCESDVSPCNSHGICNSNKKCSCDKYTYQERTGNCVLGCSNVTLFYGQCVGENLITCYGVSQLVLGAKNGPNCADCRQASIFGIDGCGSNGVCDDFSGFCRCNSGFYQYKNGVCEPQKKCGSGKFVYDSRNFEFSCDCGGLNKVNEDGSCRSNVGGIVAVSVIFGGIGLFLIIFLVIFFIKKSKNDKIRTSRMTVTEKQVARYFIE